VQTARLPGEFEKRSMDISRALSALHLISTQQVAAGIPYLVLCRARKMQYGILAHAQNLSLFLMSRVASKRSL